MGSPARSLGELLATGKVKRSGLWPQQEEAPRWDLGRLAGRFVEVLGHGASARLTVAVGLVRTAQRAGEPVAWVTPRHATVYPPDIAAHGVDLSALAVVLTDGPDVTLRAADHLLRAGAFGLVVLDFLERVDVPMHVQVRLANLAKGHDATLVCLVPEGTSRGSLASLRAASSRKRTGTGRFSCTLRVVKDKRRGRESEHVEVLDGPVGLR